MNIFFCWGCEKLSSQNYCRDCRSQLMPAGLHFNPFFPTYSLYRWNEGGTLGLWIESLKMGKNPEDWEWIAREMIRRFGATLYTFSRVWIVSAPRSSYKRDHADYLAHSLTRLLGQKRGPVVLKTGSYKQRSLTKKQRLQMILQVPEINTWDYSEGDAVLMVDDVYTTGGTAQAVYQALGKPGNFFVWTLAYRGLSCE